MNLRYSLLLILSLVVFSTAQSQTLQLSGKIMNEKNEPLVGVSVKIEDNKGTTSDIEGRFSLNLQVGKKYELTFSAIGYASKIIADIEVLPNQVNELNIVLETEAKTEENVVIKATRSNARQETAASLIAFQKNTNTVASVISAETIRRSPDKNTGEVLKRTPGTSLLEGKFIVVRGLADRYNQAMINGVPLTSTEPDRKTFSFDVIPASMIDNIIVNKAFVPEYPGEWAGGLIQVNTKDIPSKNFFSLQLGTGFNTQTISNDYYKSKGGKTDWLGIDDGARALPKSYISKGRFDILTPSEKVEIGKVMSNDWKPIKTTAPLNVSLQANGGFAGFIGNKKVGGTFGLLYSKSDKFEKIKNLSNNFQNGVFDIAYDYTDNRYVESVTLGGVAALALELNPKNRISFKALANVNSSNSITNREGEIIETQREVRGTDFTFRQNTFVTTQLNGNHRIAPSLNFNWYGSFNILDGYSPDQRRIQYVRNIGTNDPYKLLISNTLSQESGSRVFQTLSDYIYTAGGNLSYNFRLFNRAQTVKGGYLLQVKDRLYDASLFAIYLPGFNEQIKELPQDQIFASSNFGTGMDGDHLFGFNAIKGNTFRYLANTILNAGFVQFDNQFTEKLRVVWGLRVENYDQLVGSVKVWDNRHIHSEILDFLPGVNITYKANTKTNIRISGSQTVIRPEFRELSRLNLYDFDLNASIQGNPNLERTKVSNVDVRYEIYPRSGETFSVGAFYKHFDKPIEQIFVNGGGGSSTFNYANPESANSFGVEVELRKRLDIIGLNNFTLQANGAYIHSRIKDNVIDIDRPMQGQSPYLINLGLMYDLPVSGLNATLLFNQIGERIYLVGDIRGGAGSPDVWEAPRALLDFQVGKKMFKDKAELKLTIADLLNQTQYFYQNANNKTSFQKNNDTYRFTRKFGTSFGISFNYAF